MKDAIVAHFSAVKMACVMACYRPTRNCYSFAFMKFYRVQFAIHTVSHTIGLQGYTSHLFIAIGGSARKMDSLLNTLIHANTHSHVIEADYSHSRHRSIWEVNNFWKLPFIVSTFNNNNNERHGTFPNVYFFVSFLLGRDFCVVVVFFLFGFWWCSHKWPISFIHKYI